MTRKANTPPPGNQERTSPSLADAWDVVCKTAGSLLEELLQTHRDEILKCWVDSGGNEYALTSAINFKGAANAPLVKLKLSWTTKYSDEASEQIDDGTQTKLPLEPDDREEAAEHKRKMAESRRNRLMLEDTKGFVMGEGAPIESAEAPASEPLALNAPGEDIVDATFEMVEETPPTPDNVTQFPLAEILGEDELKAVAIIRAEGEVSTSLIQRRMRLGFTKSVSLLEALYNKGVIAKSGKPTKWAMVESIAGDPDAQPAE